MLTVVHLVALLATYTYAVLFPLTVVEGPIVTIVAGYLAYLGYVNPFVVYFLVVAGDITGDLVWYAAGRWGRRRYTGKWSRYVGLTPERLMRIEKHFERHSGKTLVLGKFTQAVGALVLVGAGAAKVRPRRFILFNLAATLPKSLALLLFGYYFGQAYNRAGSMLNYVALGTVSLAVLVTLTYLVPRRFARQFQ